MGNIANKITKTWNVGDYFLASDQESLNKGTINDIVDDNNLYHCLITGGTESAMISGNTIDGTHSLAVGEGNRIHDDNTIVGGSHNDVQGNNNIVGGYNSTINGGLNNIISGNHQTSTGNNNIIGGYNHQNQGNRNIIGGTNNIVDSNAENNLVAGSGNHINPHNVDNIIAGANNTSDGSESLIIGANNTNSGVNTIINGDHNVNNGGPTLIIGSTNTNNDNNTAIIASENCSTHHADRAVILGLNGFTAPTGDMVYLPNLRINSIVTDLTQNDLIAINSDGQLVKTQRNWYGMYNDNVIDAGVSSTSSTSWQLKSVLTIPAGVATGRYKIIVTYSWAGSSTSYDFRAQVNVDGSQVMYHSEEPKQNGTTNWHGYSNTYFFDITDNTVNHSVVLNYRSENSSATAYIRDVTMEYVYIRP